MNTSYGCGRSPSSKSEVRGSCPMQSITSTDMCTMKCRNAGLLLSVYNHQLTSFIYVSDSVTVLLPIPLLPLNNILKHKSVYYICLIYHPCHYHIVTQAHCLISYPHPFILPLPFIRISCFKVTLLVTYVH